MARKVFKSKIDWWLWFALVIGVVGALTAAIVMVLDGGEPLLVTVIILVCVASGALVASIVLGTSYTVDRDVLTIRSGPLRWKVPVGEITSVEATRNPLSSPALSLDRLLIRYGKRRRIMVSPADREGFLQAIGQELTR